jgi:hypothetical protein
MIASLRRSLMIGWIAAGLQVLALGQSASAQSTPEQNAPQTPPAQSTNDSASDSGARTAPATALSAVAGLQVGGDVEAEDTSKDLPQIPGLLGGTGITPTFLSELERSNYLRGGVNVGGTYDDNPLLAPSGQQVSNTSETIFPNISLERSSARERWTLGYAGGLTINQKITSQNQGSHNLNFDSQFRLSPHVSLRVAENFSLTTGYFDAGNGAPVVGGSGGPNTSLITPLATQRSNLTTVETNYHFALNDLVGASGSFYDLHFSNPPSNGSAVSLLTDSQTATGSAFWLHRIFRGDWGGGSYRFDRIAFTGGETRVHSFFVVNTLDLSHRFSLTVFAGPQYADNENEFVVAGVPQSSQSKNWTGAGGAEAGWRNQRTSVSAGYSRSISDGGGLLGAVRLQNVYGNVRRELVPGWTVALNASHGTNQSLLLPSPSGADSIHLTSAGIALERNVGKSFGLRMGYNHDFQQEFGLSAPNPPTLDAHRNRVFVTLSYQWAKPLGM